MKLWSKLTQKSRDNFQIGQNIQVIKRTLKFDVYFFGKPARDFSLDKTADKLEIISNKLINNE